MTQDNRECNYMNSAFEKLRISLEESDKKLAMPRPKPPEKEAP